MKQIYDFEQYEPPVFNENMLRTKQNEKKINVQTTLLVIAGLLLQRVVVLFGYSAIDWYPWISALCFGYVLISTTGGGIIAITYTKKGGATL